MAELTEIVNKLDDPLIIAAVYTDRDVVNMGKEFFNLWLCCEVQIYCTISPAAGNVLKEYIRLLNVPVLIRPWEDTN